jgi:hypothetical protein
MNDNLITYSGSKTTGAASTNKKKECITIADRFVIRNCIYKGLYHNTYKGTNFNIADRK